MKYFKVLLGENKAQREVTPLYVKASDMHRVTIWVLQNRPMEDFYGMNIIQVDPVTKETFRGADFLCEAVSDYWHCEYPDLTDEEIRAAILPNVIARYQKGVA